jgi:hypothetical protein
MRSVGLRDGPWGPKNYGKALPHSGDAILKQPIGFCHANRVDFRMVFDEGNWPAGSKLSTGRISKTYTLTSLQNHLYSDS